MQENSSVTKTETSDILSKFTQNYQDDCENNSSPGNSQVGPTPAELADHTCD